MPLPESWEWAPFARVAEIAANLVDPAEWQNLPHVAPDTIERDTGRLLEFRTIAEDGVKSAKHRFYPGQLLYSKIRPYLNKCVRVDFEGLCSADMYPINSFVDPGFLHYYMLTHQFVGAVSKAAGSRTVLPKTNQKQLAEVPVPVAPLQEQERIVEAIDSFLTRLGDAISSLERAQRNLERYRASVLKAAIEGRLVPTEAELARAEGRDYEPASVLLERSLSERRRRWEEAELAKWTAKGKAPKSDKWKEKYKEPESPSERVLPHLPEGWCWMTLNALIVWGPQNGLYVPKSQYGDGTPILRIDDFQADWSRSFAELQQVEISEATESKFGLRVGEIVVNRVNSPSHLGKSLAVLERHLPAVFESNMMRFELADAVDPSFVQFYLSSNPGRARLTANAKWAVNQASINQDDVGSTPVPLPPRAEQERIVSEIQHLLSAGEASAANTSTVLGRCRRLRQAILKWAFEGRLVDQDPSDEPASQLLERIKSEARSSHRNQSGRRRPRPVTS